MPVSLQKLPFGPTFEGTNDLTITFDLCNLNKSDDILLKEFPSNNLSEANRTILSQQKIIESQENEFQKLKKVNANYESLEKKYNKTFLDFQTLQNNFDQISKEKKIPTISSRKFFFINF